MRHAGLHLLGAGLAGFLIAYFALGFAGVNVHVLADEVSEEELILVCPDEKRLMRLLSREFQTGCNLSLWSDVDLRFPLGSISGSDYTAWLYGFTDDPAEPFERVDRFKVRIFGFRGYVATAPLTFLDEHWLDGDSFGENAIKFGLRHVFFEQWGITIDGLPDQPVAVASIQ